MITLKEIRENKNITQDNLASQIGITQQYISMIENGERTGSINTLKKIAEALEVPIDKLIT